MKRYITILAHGREPGLNILQHDGIRLGDEQFGDGRAMVMGCIANVPA